MDTSIEGRCDREGSRYTKGIEPLIGSVGAILDSSVSLSLTAISLSCALSDPAVYEGVCVCVCVCVGVCGC